MSSVRIVVIVPELLNCRHASPETQAFGQIILHPFGHGMPAHSIKVCMDCFMRFSGLSLRNVENRGDRHVN